MQVARQQFPARNVTVAGGYPTAKQHRGGAFHKVRNKGGHRSRRWRGRREERRSMTLSIAGAVDRSCGYVGVTDGAGLSCEKGGVFPGVGRRFAEHGGRAEGLGGPRRKQWRFARSVASTRISRRSRTQLRGRAGPSWRAAHMNHRRWMVFRNFPSKRQSAHDISSDPRTPWPFTALRSSLVFKKCGPEARTDGAISFQPLTSTPRTNFPARSDDPAEFHWFRRRSHIIYRHGTNAQWDSR